jgi:hypothetical protein
MGVIKRTETPEIPSKDSQVFVNDWDSKNRAQLIGGRSHDAAQLVHAAITGGLPIETALEMYKQALIEVLKLSDEIR